MRLKLSSPPQAYSAGDQAQMRGAIEHADTLNLKRGTSEALFLLTAPNGTVYAVTVDNAGALHTAAV